MKMNLNNTSESHESSETLSQEILSDAAYTSENCSSDTDSACDSCSVKTGEIIKTAAEQNKTMCGYKNQQKEQTYNAPPHENRVTDLPYREECTKVKTAELCSSEENTTLLKNSESKIKDKNINTPSPSDCSLEKSTNLSPMEICERSYVSDSKRIRRNSKRKRDVEDFCPVCGVTVRYSELEGHYAKEVENLSKISKGIRKSRSEENQGVKTTFVQVKSNRENRHAAKVAKFSTRPRNEVHCPVCSVRLTGTQDEINNHVLNCINEEDNYEEINVVDGDDEDSFQEYEFADQTRVRAISFVPGGYRSLIGNTAKCRHNEDDEDLNVDVDDTLAYGSPQYTELDVIHNDVPDRDKEQLEQLRKAVLLNSSAERHVIECRKWGNTNVDDLVKSEDGSSALDKSTIEANANEETPEEKKTENIEDQESCRNEAANQIVSSLKEKIKDLEEQNKSVKCLICLEPYTKPVVSTTCWHVHCEECWLMTMGVKKLCPQCNMIVFPSDLRRIYL